MKKVKKEKRGFSFLRENTTGTKKKIFLKGRQ